MSADGVLLPTGGKATTLPPGRLAALYQFALMRSTLDRCRIPTRPKNSAFTVPIFGKTGTTANAAQTRVVTSMTKIATATWITKGCGSVRLRSEYFHGVSGGDVKSHIGHRILTALDQRFGGTAFTLPTRAMVGGPVHAIG